MSERRGGASLIELVHLAFLQVLPSHLRVGDYIVKGGANLRLFYHSRRRSQDIDLDYIGGHPEELEDRIDRCLASSAFGGLLRLAGVAVTGPTKPKQTATTRRWKFAVEGPGAHLNSKIEFSARGPGDPEHALEPARDDIGRDIGLRVVKAEHYLPPAAIRQKIRALAERSATEPRDVFDLDLLFGRFPDAIRRGDVGGDLPAKAATAALGIEFAAYEELVVEFIDDEFVESLGREEVWSDMVLRVVERLEALA